MKVTVLRYDQNSKCHVCRDWKGLERRIDLMVCGDLPFHTPVESIIGKRVEIKQVTPFVEIAKGVTVVD